MNELKNCPICGSKVGVGMGVANSYFIVHIVAQKLEQGAEKTVTMTLLMFGTHLKRESINKKISLNLALFVAVQM